MSNPCFQCLDLGDVCPVHEKRKSVFTPPPEESTLREELRKIATRDGMTGKIPELLEQELDRLEKLTLERERLARIEEGQYYLSNAAELSLKRTVGVSVIKERIKDLSKQAVKVKVVKT